jgi:hypothetical protein
MILRHLHVQRLTTVAQILTRQDSALLTNKQCSAVRVAAHVVWADGQVSDLEALDAVHVETLVKDTVFDDGVAFAWGHGARAEGVPGSFDVAWGRLVDHVKMR